MKLHTSFFAAILLLAATPGFGPPAAGGTGWARQVTPQDIDKILERADALLEEAKAAYEEARTRSSVPAFVDAGFKLEEARIKYIVLQEIGAPDKQKIAADRLRAVNQLSKLIHDGRVAISGAFANPPTAGPADPAAAPPAPDPSAAPPPAPAKAPVDVTKRAAVPDADRLKEATRLVRDLFKDQFAKKTPAERKALARLLLDHSRRSKDDLSGAWVLLREAEDLALQAGDLETAIEALERRAEEFDIDLLQARGALLASFAKTAKSAEEARELSEALLRHVDELVGADQYEPADKAAAAALAQAKKAGDAALLTLATTRSREVAEMKSLFQAHKRVLEKLASDAEDPGANLETGKFLCFVKGAWDLGLRFLAKGSDTALKALAEKELAFPETVIEQVALADSWYDLGEKEKSPLRKGRLLGHARALYERALPSAPALVRAKIEKRMEGLAPTGGASEIDLLRLIDPKRDAVAGEWSWVNRALVCDSTRFARIQVPYEPPEEYDLTMVAERKEGGHCLYVGLAGPSFQCYVGVDDWFGTLTGIGWIDGKLTKDNETAVFGKILVNGRPSTIVCAVRKDGISVTIDGRKVTAYKGSMSRLSNADVLPMPNTRALWVGASDNRAVFHKLQLKPLSGAGKRTR